MPQTFDCIALSVLISHQLVVFSFTLSVFRLTVLVHVCTTCACVHTGCVLTLLPLFTLAVLVLQADPDEALRGAGGGARERQLHPGQHVEHLRRRVAQGDEPIHLPSVVLFIDHPSSQKLTLKVKRVLGHSRSRDERSKQFCIHTARK